MTDSATCLPGSDALVAELRRLAEPDTLPPALREHALGIGAILAELELGPVLSRAGIALPLAAAGILPGERLPALLGTDAAQLVDEVLALPAVETFTPSGETAASPAQAENLRKLLLAVIRDARVLVIRLADRLQALRTLPAGAAAQHRALARAAREIHAPLASRLGIWQLKWELEDLAFRHLEPDNYHKVADWLNERRADREAFVADTAATLRVNLASAGIEATVSGRPKHIYSIWRKLQRKQLDFEQIYDLRALRVMVGNITDCYAALGVVHGLWHHIPKEFDDYIATPKGNQYRSLHTAVVGPDGRPVEIQIRTHAMHRHAELGVAAHWRYKEGTRFDAALETRIGWMRQLLAPGGSDQDFMDQLRTELVEERVYVLTPKGAVLDLPRGATPLDFAYYVHTDIGHRCRGARVNGRLLPLTQVLENGDQVEILTGREAEPSRDWLNPLAGFLATSRARDKVRAFFRAQDRDLNIRYGRDALERELDRLGLRDFRHDRLLSHFSFTGLEELLAALGAGDVSLAQINGALQRELATSTQPPHTPPRIPVTRSRHAGGPAVDVAGVGNLLTSLARCCNPLPGEAIRGYITRGHGITLHRAGCASLARLLLKAPQREIAVSWLADQSSTPVRLLVEARDRRNLLSDITSVVANEKIGIQAMQAQPDSTQGRARVQLTVSLPDLAALSRLLQRLVQIPGVERAVRETTG
ncbi:MAG TPA: bifunctional (p)ppGpp synthetase/guanosine-3',5'-bis(diphosphate) 3'-pyrophosphohydrolase [Gammaproteobacteria bacterium]|nr:bifunctional (p)ppGpp synthetase/guanosine-3',5'-bis(diphosphate) 3'-pyrophosphohydrolase [Gammaproteobacteria bacterium]